MGWFRGVCLYPPFRPHHVLTNTSPLSAVTPFMTAAPDAPVNTFTSLPSMGVDDLSRRRITEHPRHFVQCTLPSAPGGGLGGGTPPGTASSTH